MDAIEYLTDQHREIESVFDQLETAARMKPKLRLWRKLADLIAIHIAIEERIFFPAARNAGMEELLLKALDEHLSTALILSELVDADEVNDEMVARLAILRAYKRQHAGDEERELFPRASEVLTPDELEMLGRELAETTEQLMGRDRRERLIARIAHA